MYLEHWEELVDRWDDSPASCRSKVLEEVLYGRGVPVQIRRKLWIVSSGALRKSKRFPHTYSEYADERIRQLETGEFIAIEAMIQKDVGRTFSLFFDKKSKEGNSKWKQHERSLYNVLCAIALSTQEVKYHQGLNFIVALLLIVLQGDGWDATEENTFWVIHSVLKEYHLLGLYLCKSSFIQQYIDQFDMLIRRFSPKLRQHLTKQGFSVSFFALEWFTTVFCYSLRLDAVYLVWDLFLVTKLDESLFVVGLAILHHLSPQIFAIQNFEDMVDVFKNGVKNLTARELRDSICVVVQRIVPSALIPPGKSTLASIERAIGDSGNPNNTSEYNASVFLQAIQLGDADGVIEELGKYRFPQKVIEYSLSRAAFLGYDTVVQALLDSKCDPTCPSILVLTEGLSPLHIAAICGHATVARLLLKAGADRNIPCTATVLKTFFLGNDLKTKLDGYTALEMCQEDSAVGRVLSGKVCLSCEHQFETPGWILSSPHEKADKASEWDGDYCITCSPEPPQWHCKGCKRIGSVSIECHRCHLFFCTVCTFTRRKLLPVHHTPVTVCNNCHHVLRSCPCPKEVVEDFNVYCDHSPVDYLTMKSVCDCFQCQKRRYSVKIPNVYPWKYDGNPIYPLYVALSLGFGDRGVSSSIGGVHRKCTFHFECTSKVDLFLYSRIETVINKTCDEKNTVDKEYRDYRAELVDFYSHWNPSRISQVDTLLEKYKGGETKLLNDLHRMYANE